MKLNLISENKEKDDESIEVDCVDFDNNINKVDDNNENSPFGIHLNSDGFGGIHGGMPEMHSVQQCAPS